MAHFDLELHQMDITTVFHNGDIDGKIYTIQPENFVSGDPENMICGLKKSIYVLNDTERNLNITMKCPQIKR
ncbi:UNVERIFIED_CONTAM: hypothetical protein Sangu_2860500 [Sesamum angustifolium]|uniref:Reverse transcriptase Ty1/copia-type domain-containing protein n=1 Tax=Sesamum angustifolium TaxID=2727405 RepID=A0AAW2IPU1_9LAMI